MTSAPGASAGALTFGTQSRGGATTDGKDWPFLQASGEGKFVGVTASMEGPWTRGFLEGDERVYTEGARSPQIHGTGTEDFYQSGWYFNRDVYTQPFNGEPAHLFSSTGCAAESDCTGAYRLMIGDAVPFGSAIDFGIEHGPGDDVAANYSTTAFWYGRPAASQRRTDTLTVGNDASERAHDYTSPDPGPVTTLDSTFEGTNAPLTAATRSTSAPVTFRVNVDPANHGAVLRRTSDQKTALPAREGQRRRPRAARLAPAARQRHAPLAGRLLPAPVERHRRAPHPHRHPHPGGHGLVGGVVRRVEHPVTGPEPPVVLAMRGIAKSFPGVRALSGVDLTVHAGEVAALLGENGAGKSTLMNVLAGVHGDYEGTIEVGGEEAAIHSPKDAQRHGIAMIHQELNLVPDLSVADNIFLGA